MPGCGNADDSETLKSRFHRVVVSRACSHVEADARSCASVAHTAIHSLLVNAESIAGLLFEKVPGYSGTAVAVIDQMSPYAVYA